MAKRWIELGPRHDQWIKKVCIDADKIDFIEESVDDFGGSDYASTNKQNADAHAQAFRVKEIRELTYEVPNG